MIIESPNFEYTLVVEKKGEVTEFSGKECLVDFKNSGIEGVTKIGWVKTDKSVSIFASLIDGSFTINDRVLVIDLGLSDKDVNGNIKALTFDDLTLEPIWFRRIREDYKPEGTLTTVKYCIGWKTKEVGGRVYQKILSVDSNNNITLSDRK